MRLLTVIALTFSLSLASNAGDGLSDENITATATAFLEAKNGRQQHDTKIEDIDHFLSFLADEFIDEHLAYGVTITDKTKLRAGMTRKMEDTIYSSKLTIDEMMIGPNVAFVKYTEDVKLKRAGSDETVSYKGMSVMSLEFNAEGKITHIRRHSS